jgi:hypothetical protein
MSFVLSLPNSHTVYSHTAHSMDTCLRAIQSWEAETEDTAVRLRGTPSSRRPSTVVQMYVRPVVPSSLPQCLTWRDKTVTQSSGNRWAEMILFRREGVADLTSYVSHFCTHQMLYMYCPFLSYDVRTSVHIRYDTGRKRWKCLGGMMETMTEPLRIDEFKTDT